MYRLALLLFLNISIIFGSYIGSANATPWYEPDGLSSGDIYHLAFVTSTSIDGRSFYSNYELLVENAANASIGLDMLSWKPIVYALGGGDPLSEIGFFSGSVYNTDGGLVAPDDTIFWSPDHINPIAFDETGAPSPYSEVWTGSDEYGLGRYILGGLPAATYGLINSNISGYWMNFGEKDTTNLLPVYAISGEIIAAGQPIPEPTTIVLFGLGLLGFAGVSRRKK